METDDNFVSIGTALEPIEEDDAPKKKPIAVSDQIVTDEKGRRRFHGAFTGGFSAGYFNTVGTKEGWTPSTFKSTRKDRSNLKNQNVQDFMDEEDLGAFGIAPQMLRTTSEFEQETRKRGKPSENTSGPIPGVPVLEQLIQPVKDTVGVRILLRLGWRHGKGLGPLRSRKSKRGQKEISSMPTSSANLTDKMYSCARGDQDTGSESEGSDEDVENIDVRAVLPDDSQNILCNPKENLFGLGYSGLDRNTLSFGNNNLLDPQLRFRVNNKNLSIRGEAFGIGAFEDEDEEVYSREDASDYDFALETPDERKNRRLQERGSTNKKTDERDGCIAGFVRAKLKSSSQRLKFYPAPTIPKDFVPKHSVKQSRFQKSDSTTIVEESRKIGLDRHKLTAEERKILLNDAADRIHEKETKTEANKEQDTEEARRKLAALRAERLLKFTSVLEQNQPKCSEASFKPFANNPEKQERYEKYTTLVAAGFQECLKDLQPLEMTEWEREREMLEFQRASSLYKPLAGVISSRFVSAKSHDISNQALSKEAEKEKLASEDPHTAAKMNLFGKLTHQIFEWHPDRLLCKRFNVPHPFPESKIIGIPRGFGNSADNVTDSPALSNEPEPQAPTNDSAELSAPKKKSLFENIDFSKPPPGLVPLTSIASNSDSVGDELTPASGLNQDQDNQDLIVKEKPSRDLFKEIFADTSGESESEEEEEEKAPKQDDRSRKIPSTYERNTQKVEVVDDVSVEVDDAYGPQLPASLAKGVNVSRPIKFQPVTKTTIEENLWVEKEVLNKKSKVKAHKTKKSKSKSKSKHKEKRHHKSDKTSKDRSRSKKKKKKSSRHGHRESESEKSSDSEIDSDFGVDDAEIQASERTKKLLYTLKTLVEHK